jgi:hypothetical protein
MPGTAVGVERGFIAINLIKQHAVRLLSRMKHIKLQATGFKLR